MTLRGRTQTELCRQLAPPAKPFVSSMTWLRAIIEIGCGVWFVSPILFGLVHPFEMFYFLDLFCWLISIAAIGIVFAGYSKIPKNAHTILEELRWFYVFGGLFFISFFSALNNFVLGSIAIFGSGICLLVHGRMLLHREYQKVAVGEPRWKTATSRWNALFYCGRCDGVFLPNISELVPSSKLVDYVYRD